ncbi:hypothetical protein ANN_14863 [Periplaneta americana]|uniref:Uncharacterized protein n=1 Tax=Periplaneta americana TaxID=6978 RepID=A0ABQ8SXH2_PERAM|nr:hypothetical protein ANN_14863 [Periplaneta americana]
MAGLCEGGNEHPSSLKASTCVRSRIAPALGGSVGVSRSSLALVFSVEWGATGGYSRGRGIKLRHASGVRLAIRCNDQFEG